MSHDLLCPTIGQARPRGKEHVLAGPGPLDDGQALAAEIILDLYVGEVMAGKL